MTKALKLKFAALLLVAAALGGYFAFQPAFGANSVDGIVRSWINGGAFGSTDQLQINSSGEITQTASSTFATTTVAASYDGFSIGGTITSTSVATTSAITLYTHTGGRALCDAHVAGLYADSVGYSPNLTISVGTSTGATPTTNLVASTTLATSTDTVVTPTASLFLMTAGDRINAMLSDGITNASSTNFANWKIEFQTHCWSIGI